MSNTLAQDQIFILITKQFPLKSNNYKIKRSYSKLATKMNPIFKLFHNIPLSMYTAICSMNNNINNLKRKEIPGKCDKEFLSITFFNKYFWLGDAFGKFWSNFFVFAFYYYFLKFKCLFHRWSITFFLDRFSYKKKGSSWTFG